jgi:hypothetical protein
LSSNELETSDRTSLNMTLKKSCRMQTSDEFLWKLLSDAATLPVFKPRRQERSCLKSVKKYKKNNNIMP